MADDENDFRARRRALAEYLRAVPAEQYDHTLWVYTEHDGEDSLSAVINSGKEWARDAAHSCNTVACVAGWAVLGATSGQLAFPKEVFDTEVVDLAKFLGVSSKVFFDNGYPHRMKDDDRITLADVIEKIESYGI